MGTGLTATTFQVQYMILNQESQPGKPLTALTDGVLINIALEKEAPPYFCKSVCGSFLSRVTSQNTILTLTLYIKLNQETHQWENKEKLSVVLLRANNQIYILCTGVHSLLNTFQVQHTILHQNTQRWGNRESPGGGGVLLKVHH